MNGRFILIAAATLMAGSVNAAEPLKPGPQPAAQPQHAPAQIVLASADEVRTPSPDQQASSPPKRRVARVTTCRCGDAETQSEE